MDPSHGHEYSATVVSYLIVCDVRYRLAKTNGSSLTLDEDCELDPGTVAEMAITVDGDTEIQTVELPEGARRGQRKITYRRVAPF